MSANGSGSGNKNASKSASGNGGGRGPHRVCTKSKESLCESVSEAFATIPFYKDKYSAFDDTAIHLNKNATYPIIEPKSEKYTPIPYIFRVPDTSNNRSIKTVVRCPPFHVQLDHAVAVVWSLYSSEETDIPLGINQLQWAYSFLKNVKDKDMTYPRDVEHCINTITEELIEQYAELADDTPTPKSSEFSFNPVANSTRADVADDADAADADGNAKGAAKTQACACRYGTTVRFADEVQSTCSGSTNSAACSKQPDYPFSVTYNDMYLHKASLNTSAPPKKDVCNRDNSKVGTFLNEMRKDQLQKILAELDRLHAIEKYIGNANNEFEPYMNDEDKELNDYIAAQLDSCKNNECTSKEKDQDLNNKKPSETKVDDSQDDEDEETSEN